LTGAERAGGLLVSDAVLVLLVLGYVLDAVLCFIAGYVVGRRRRPPRRVQTHLHRR
jgi:hypothetical protein